MSMTGGELGSRLKEQRIKSRVGCRTEMNLVSDKEGARRVQGKKLKRESDGEEQ